MLVSSTNDDQDEFHFLVYFGMNIIFHGLIFEDILGRVSFPGYQIIITHA